jgi:hypothetical protein
MTALTIIVVFLIVILAIGGIAYVLWCLSNIDQWP